MQQDDAPPEKAVDAIEMAAANTAGKHGYTCAEDVRAEIVKRLRALPAADRQALAEWIAPPGMVLVPREPTEAMCDAGWIDKEDVTPKEIYHAMLAAANPTEKKD